MSFLDACTKNLHSTPTKLFERLPLTTYIHCQLIKLIVIIVRGEISTWMLDLWHIKIPLFPGEGLYFPGFSRLNKILWSLQLANQDKGGKLTMFSSSTGKLISSHCVSFTSCRVTMGELSG